MAQKQLAAIVNGERKGLFCPACGRRVVLHNERTPKAGDLALCGGGPFARPGDGCGHIFAMDGDGTVRNLTTTEKAWMRKENEKYNGRGKARQEVIVSRMIG